MQPDAERDRRRGAAAAARDLGDGRPCVVLAGDVPLVDAPRRSQALVDAHAASGAAATMADAELDDPTGYGRVVRDADGERRARRRDQGARATRRPRSSRSARSTPASTRSTAGALLERARRGSSTDNAQGELYLPTCSILLRGDGARRRGPRRRRPDARARRQRPRRRSRDVARARPARASIDAHMLAGVTIVDPATTRDRRGRRDRRATRRSSRSRPARRDAHRRRLHDRPVTTLIDAGSATASPSCTPTSSTPSSSDGVDASARSPTCAPARVLREGAKAGTFVEVKNSDIGAGHESAAPLLHRRRRRRRGHEPRRGNDHRQLRRRRKHRTTIGERVHDGVDTSFVAPVTVGDDAYTGAGSVDHRGRARPARSAIARARQTQHRGLRRARRGGRGEHAGTVGITTSRTTP